MLKIKFPDESIKEFPDGITSLEIAHSISEGLARRCLAAKLNEEVWELSRPIHADASLRLLTWNDTEGKSVFWHSSAHLMAEALETLYPGVKFGIGPPVEWGFYYDVDLGEKVFSSDDFKAVEDKMLELSRKSNAYIRKPVSKKDALDYFTNKGDEYKLDLINDLEDGTITFYTQGNFTDLCRGPHIPDTGFIKAIKLLNVAGAYWRGDEKRKQLTRIYGITFPKQGELEEFLKRLEEAKKRDHRKLGKELEIFHYSEKVGMGLPLWLPKGVIIRERLETFLKNEQRKRGYSPVMTPHIGKKDLYVTSGHYEKYGKESFQPIFTPNHEEEYLLKPMNCPHHCEIYKSKPHSYRDLPVRLSEFGTVYRYEQSGELNGLTRTRGFTQDDAHIFCREDQVKEEFISVIDLVMHVFKNLGFSEYTAQISLSDPKDRSKYIGSQDLWHKAEQAIISATKETGLKTVTVLGEAAFYGPKLDFMVKDVIGRNWQLGTIQVDYNLPERFELEYTGADNLKHRPVMIHRAPFGSMERFIGILIEHCSGNFPLWLTPEPVVILPVSEKYIEYGKKVALALNEKEIPAIMDAQDDKVGKKIRDSELKKIPFMLIVGEKEEKDGMVAVRRHGKGDLGIFTLENFVALFREEAGMR